MNAAKAYRMYVAAAGNLDQGAAGSMQTGLAVVNRSTSTATVTVDLFRPDGSFTGFTGSLLVPPGGQTVKFLSQIPGLELLALPFAGVARVSSPSEISVMGLRGRYNERNDFLITTTPPIEEASVATDANLVFPHFARGGGYTTQFVLFSGAGEQPSSGSVRFLSQSGEPINLELQ